MKKQKSFFKASRKEHGGVLAVGKRRAKRPLATKNSIHITMRSDLAKCQRSLMKHKNLIRKVVLKASKRFEIKVYRYAICGNHLHFLIKGSYKSDIQNFFRVVAGHIAQGVLKLYPLTHDELRKTQWGGVHAAQIIPKKPCLKNQRKFWALLLYSRIITWGKEFQTVSKYILQNTLEALNLIAYQPRKSRRFNTS